MWQNYICRFINWFVFSRQRDYIFTKRFKVFKKIGYVPQEVPIINGSIINNICLGEEENFLMILKILISAYKDS